MMLLAPSDMIVNPEYCVFKIFVATPLIVCAPLQAIVIVPIPPFRTTYILPALPTAVGRVTVNVPLVQSIV